MNIEENAEWKGKEFRERKNAARVIFLENVSYTIFVT